MPLPFPTRNNFGFFAGQRVAYTPNYEGAVPEYGVAVRANEQFVFVVFDGEIHAKACNPKDLK